jgi:hypothetical protein
MSFNGPNTQQHKCMAAGCERQISYTYVMCMPHWRALQPQTADGLYFAWSAYRFAPSRGLISRARNRLDLFLAEAQQQLTQQPSTPQP